MVTRQPTSLATDTLIAPNGPWFTPACFRLMPNGPWPSSISLCHARPTTSHISLYHARPTTCGHLIRQPMPLLAHLHQPPLFQPRSSPRTRHLYTAPIPHARMSSTQRTPHSNSYHPCCLHPPACCFHSFFVANDVRNSPMQVWQYNNTPHHTHAAP